MFEYLFTNFAKKKEEVNEEEVLQRTITLSEFSAICSIWMSFQKDMNGMKQAELRKLINPLVMLARLYSEREGKTFDLINGMMNEGMAERKNEKGL
jgi:hypothetical protein